MRTLKSPTSVIPANAGIHPPTRCATITPGAVRHPGRPNQVGNPGTLVAFAVAALLAVGACSADSGQAASRPVPTTGATTSAEPPPTVTPPAALPETPTAVLVAAAATPTSAPTPQPTVQATPTSSPTAQPTPTRTAATQPTATPTSSAMPQATPTPTRTATLSATPTPTATPTSTATPEPTPTPTPAIPSDAPAVFFDESAFSVELALTSDQQSQGLSDRDSLAPGTGMLFVFAPRRASAFWMFRMRFPIDIVWISANCAVVDITVEAPAPEPDTPTSDLPTYSSSSDAGYVLEINAGKAAEQGIEIGDAVRFANVSNPDGQACP